MKKCMETDKPLISILMAVYEPNIKWLIEQLISLNEQTYPNIKLYIRDDSSSLLSYHEIEDCVNKYITKFPVEIQRNEQNMGSNKTFERLTLEAQGEYFAYCDQDDIWLPEKIEALKNVFDRESSALLVCSDMYVIDGDGKQIADSITKVRKRHCFYSGKDLAGKLLFHNFVTGCTMMIPASIAKRFCPFCPHMVHDHYLAVCCSSKGSIISLSHQLVKVRFHGKNQTEVMAGVNNKQNYKKIRIDIVLQRLMWLKENVTFDTSLTQKIDDGIIWAKARQRNWESAIDIFAIKIMLKYMYFGKFAVIFELFAKYLPKFMFCGVIALLKRNII